MATVRLDKVFVALLVTCSLHKQVQCGVRLLSSELKDTRVDEGGSITFNCTITGRESNQERISWVIDWTPWDKLEGHSFFAEANENIENIPDDHGTFTLEYNRIQNGVNETDAIHVCLLKITDVKINDNGQYGCSYYHSGRGVVAIISRPSSLFVIPSERPPVTVKKSTQASTTTIYPGGSGSNSGSAVAGGVTAVLFIIIVILVSIWAIFRYKRYKRDKKGQTTQLPMDLTKVDADHNSYGGVTVNGVISNETNTENPVITDDEPSVRLPPMIDSDEPPAYSSLNRPDSEIRNQLGELTYDLPPDAENSNTNYVVAPDNENPSAPSRTASRQAGDSRSSGYEIATLTGNPSVPSRSSSLQPGDNPIHSPVRTSSTNSTSYEILAEAENPSAPARSSSLQLGDNNTHTPVRTSSTNSTSYEMLGEDENPPLPAKSSSRQTDDNTPHAPVRTSSTNSTGYERMPDVEKENPAVPTRTSSKNNGRASYMDEDNLAYMADMSTVYEDVPSPDTKL